MKAWAVLFMPLLIVRPLTVLMTGCTDTVPITGWRGGEVVLGAMPAAVAVQIMHSMIVYFTIPRALGGGR